MQYDEYYDDPGSIPLTPQTSFQQINQGTQFFKLQDIRAQLDQQLRDIQEKLDLPKDSTLELLMYYNFNENSLDAEYLSQRQDEIIHQLHQKGLLLDNTIKRFQGPCNICLAYKEIVQLSCGHGYCISCYGEHFKQKIAIDGFSYSNCLYNKCVKRIPSSLIEELCPKFQEVLARTYVFKHPNLAWCTGPDCQFIVKPSDSSSKEVTCHCGHKFCFRCKEDLHPPAPCDIVQKWFTAIRKDEANIKWITANTKICPHCRRPVERSEGCNYMMCKPPGGCGKAFCYVCSNPWEPDHRDHFKCTKYNPSANPEHDRAREVLKRYNHYYERFTNSEDSRKIAQKRLTDIQNIQQAVFDIYQFTFQESSFLKENYTELVNSRTVLKWSWCYGYYINSSDQVQSKLFDYYQEQFEIACEKLAISLMLLIERIELLGNKYERDKLDINELKMEFIKKKNECQTASTTCGSYRKNLLTFVAEGR